MDAKDSRIELDEAQLRAFPLDIADEEVRRLADLLSADELARAERFVTTDLRRRFVVCRGRLRQWLASITNMPAESISFRYEAWGKPQLAAEFSSRNRLQVHFNVSHSGDQAVIAVAPCTVGVDIEVPNPRINHRAIASQIISDWERDDWRRLSSAELAEQTMRLWVCKEALLKGLGLGIAEGLTKVAFPLPIPSQGVISPSFIDAALQLHLEEDASCTRNRWLDPGGWRVQLLDGTPGCHLALATLRQVQRLRWDDV